MSDRIKHFTSCGLCNLKIHHYQMSIPVPGQEPAEELKTFMLQLHDHMRKKHPGQLEEIKNLMQNFAGVLILRLFHSEDPHLELALDLERGALHRLTRRPMEVPETGIRKKLTGLGLAGDQLDQVTDYVLKVRDAYAEDGIFSPEAHYEAVVTANTNRVVVP